MATVELRNLTKKYDNGFEAVKGISMSIRDGEFIVFVGPSGCGKTTTLRMIAGLEEATSGDIFFDSERVNDHSPKARDVGMVFQNYALYPHLTVYQNIAFPLTIRREKKNELDKRVREVADMLGLTPLLDRKPKQLSGGQRQRVALGRAIVRKPRVFLFDEPLSNLDAKLRISMRAEILHLQHTIRTTAVYVTHDQMEAMTMGDRIAVMNDGIVQQIASPEEIYNNPVNRFVAGFLGSPSMNFFEGTLVYEDGLSFREKENGITVGLAEHAFQNTPPQEGAMLTLGIRPEHIYATASSNTLAFPAIVTLTEYLGHEMLLHFTTGGTTKVSRMPSGQHYPGENTAQPLYMDAEKLFLFDTEGRRL